MRNEVLGPRRISIVEFHCESIQLYGCVSFNLRQNLRFFLNGACGEPAFG